MPAPDLHAAQHAALLQFQRWNDTPDALVIDTETTGLGGGVWNVSAATLGSLQPVLNLTCNPQTPWEDQARAMHAAHLGDVAAAPVAESRRDQVEHALSAAQVPLLAYNAPFDHAAIRRTWPGLDLLECVMAAYAPLAGQWSERRGEWKWVNLGAALTAEGVDVSDLPGQHSAAGDVMRTVRLIRAVAQRPAVVGAAPERP